MVNIYKYSQSNSPNVITENMKAQYTREIHSFSRTLWILHHNQRTRITDMCQDPKRIRGYWIRRIQYPGSYWVLGHTVLFGREPLKIMDPAIVRLQLDPMIWISGWKLCCLIMWISDLARTNWLRILKILDYVQRCYLWLDFGKSELLCACHPRKVKFSHWLSLLNAVPNRSSFLDVFYIAFCLCFWILGILNQCRAFSLLWWIILFGEHCRSQSWGRGCHDPQWGKTELN